MSVFFDRSRYTSVPRTVGTRIVSLSDQLRKHAPQQRTPEVSSALDRLAEVETRTRDGYVARHREYGPSVAAAETELDTCADMLLHAGRDRLGSWAVFEREGFSRLAAAQQPGGFDFAAAIAKAERARALTELLLARGLDFTRDRYTEQAVAMRTLATIVEREGLAAELEDLVGAEFLGAIAQVQVAYDAMIDARAVRAKGSAVDIRGLLDALTRAIEGYVITVLAMLDEDDPASVARIEAALRPLDALREQLALERGAGKAASAGEPDPDSPTESSAEAPPETPPETTASIDELLAGQRAFEAELGLAE